MKQLIVAFLLTALAACAGDLTPKQRAFDLMSQFQAAQVAAETVVTDPATPPAVKRAVQVAEKAAREAVLAYADAARRDDPGTADYLVRATRALTAMTRYLVERGYLDGAWLDLDGWRIEARRAVA